MGEVSYLNMTRVIIVCSIHEQGMGDRWFEDAPR